VVQVLPPKHKRLPHGVPHCPLEQTLPLPQAGPVPQVHTLLVQVSVVLVQALLHPPQLFVSVCRFAQLVPQSVVPAGQTQVPPEQTLPPVQALLHAPQLNESVLRLVQTPVLPQFAQPSWQHTLLEQICPLMHAVLQWPQWLGSLLVLTQLPPHSV
jgi:hypothetical protein